MFIRGNGGGGSDKTLSVSFKMGVTVTGGQPIQITGLSKKAAAILFMQRNSTTLLFYVIKGDDDKGYMYRSDTPTPLTTYFTFYDNSIVASYYYSSQSAVIDAMIVYFED